MIDKRILVDVTNVRTPVGVRQTVAAACGVPVGQEFTWESLGQLVIDAFRASEPNRMIVSGLPKLGVNLPEEATMLRGLLKDLTSRLPNLEIRVVLHD